MKLKKKNKAGRDFCLFRKNSVIFLLILLCIGFLAAVEGAFELNVHRRELKGGHIARDEKIPDSAVEHRRGIF